MGALPTLTIFLVSFSFRSGGPPEDPGGHGGGFVFDCRALPNPFWEEALKPLTGLDGAVVAFMERHPVVEDFAVHTAWLVTQAARTYGERGYERLMAAFGCTGGRHRSVYQAHRLAQTLRAAGYRVELLHRELAPAAGGGEG